MKITEITLENFRPFFSKQVVDLRTNSDKPVILMKSLNDVGKTSFFRAFKWCLYGSKSRNELQKNVNRSACCIGDGKTSVKITFYHDEKKYEIIRSVTFKQTSIGTFPEVTDEKLVVKKNGKPEELKTKKEQNEYIEAILPFEASQFFFFDGEDIQKYTDRRPQESVKEAIEMVLGIRELLFAREDVIGINQELENELDVLLKHQSKNKEEAQEVEKLGLKIKDLRKEIAQLKQQMEQAQENISSCDEVLKSNRLIQEKVKQRQEAERQKKQANEHIEGNNEKQIDFNSNFCFLIGAPLLKELSETGDQQIDTWKRAALSAILYGSSERCICDRKLTEEIIEKFEKQLEKGGASKLQYLGGMADDILLEKSFDYLRKELYDLAAERTNWISSCKLHEQTIDQLTKEIGKRGDIGADIKAAEDTRNRASIDFENYRKNKDEKIGELKVLLNNHKKRQTKLVDDERSNKDVKTKENNLKTCENCQKGINYAIEKLVTDTKTKVADLASTIFLQLTNAPDLYNGLEITDEYEIKIKTKGGAVRHVWDQDPSAGQSQIIASSFIAALNEYTAREAPIVIDTPIGRLDPIHKKNLINYYPLIGPQVIILYQPNEMADDDIENIRRSIASEWEFKRDCNDPRITRIIPLGRTK